MTTADWFADGEGVEDVGTEIDAVGPHAGAGFGVYLDLFEEDGWAEDAMDEVKLVDGASRLKAAER